MNEKLKKIVEVIEGKKGENVIVLDLKGGSSIADFFVVCTGKSNRNIQTISDEVDDRMKEDNFEKLGIEGYQEGKWILLDFDEIIVHIFDRESRENYKLEELYDETEEIYRG